MAPRKSTKRRGFALLITIVLVAFLVLIVVTLAALTRVETQVATNTRKLDAARQNALLALNVALGQLQQHAGQDTRLTAQANLIDANAGNPWFTGVWTADTNGTPAVRTWLVSGNETTPTRFGPSSILNREGPVTDVDLILDANGLATNGPESGDPNRVQIVGENTATTNGTGLDNGSVVVPGVPINTPVPGFAGDRTTGRYAWWVGDQGVKASLALPDRSAEVTYAPWYDPTPGTGHDQRARIRQQIATSPNYFRRSAAEGEYGFDPLDTANGNLLPRVLEPGHFDLLTPAVVAAPLDNFRRDHAHTFTDRTFSVLANTLPLADSARGLQRDLSQAPALLGPAFVAQTDLAAYMEAPSATNTAVPAITTYDSPRRRYRMTALPPSGSSSGDPEIEFKVAPTLSSFLIQFRFFRNGTQLAVRSRVFVEMWNPYSTALVPEALSLEITGLPEVDVTIGEDGTAAPIDLQNVPAAVVSEETPDTMQIQLTPGTGTQADHQSWLPGRIYAWRTAPTASATSDLQFYNKSISVTGWTYAATGRPLGLIPKLDEEGNQVMTPAGNPATVPDVIRIQKDSSTTVTIKLRNAAGDLLATYTSPEFPDISVQNANDSEDNWAFGLGFRLKQPSIYNRDRDWLTVPGNDIRRSQAPTEVFGPLDEQLDTEPTSYDGDYDTGNDDTMNYLFFRRASTGASAAAIRSTRSANLDVPLFELPRLPYLSIGELQHLLIPSERPFAVGNSWGNNANSWFDRFFFSGLTPAIVGPNIPAGQPLPNWNLTPLASNVATIGEFSSSKLLQAGGFNINSSLPEAWRAILSGIRFSQSHSFNRAEIENGTVNDYTGSQPETATTAEEFLVDQTLADDSDPHTNPIGGPAFFRFSQSAQETYYWEDTAIEGSFKKQAYRQGVRGGDQPIDGSDLQTLTTTQIELLADAIVTRLRAHVATAGPYRSLQDFLAPNPAWSNRNLLEQAIDDAGINPASIAPISPVADLEDIGFSSLTLSSADIMTALAPYLRTRSDTFVVRTYGESLNPVTGEVEGRAWCEATVQRFPEPLDPDETNIAAPSATGFGRKFKITRFRWLSPSEI
ncbi:MAG: hypothetical protein ABII82_13185 [Verrucomicrobiota bacterium]